MSIYMEVRCEGRGEGRPGNDRCYSDDNAGVQINAKETVKGMSEALAYLKSESLKAGWVIHKGDLYCPVCARLKAWEKDDESLSL